MFDVDLVLTLRAWQRGVRVFFDGKEIADAPSVVEVEAKTGRNRVVVRDMTCRTLADEVVEIPVENRAYQADIDLR